MSEEKMLIRANKIAIMIILGAFTLIELLYIPPEYKWGLKKVYALVAAILK